MDTVHTVQVELPQYKCHKVVRAMRIDRIEFNHDASSSLPASATVFDDTIHGMMTLDRNFLNKHNPIAVGGYIVVYEDGYKSFSPAKAFEEGYTRA